MVPKMMNITLLLLQGFFFQLRKIHFLPSWCKCSLSHLPLLGSCNGVNYIEGFTLIWRRLPRDILRHWPESSDGMESSQ